MKKWLFLMAFAAVVSTVGAKDKVVETSGKQPKWIYAVEKEYLIVSAESESLEEAKSKCMVTIKKQILASVAENVEAQASLNTFEQEKNGQYDMMQTYASMVETKSAKIPFLCEVSISKAEDFYWEKIKNKKVYRYRYHLKYPFGKFDLARMVDAFQSGEDAINNQLKDFAADDFSSYTSVEQMTARIQALRLFKATLLEEDKRLEQVERIERVYGEYIRSIQLSLVSIDREEVVFVPTFRGKELTMKAQPKMKSNCLTNMQFTNRGTQCVVAYDSTDCAESEKNYIDISFNIGGNKVKNRFTVK